MRATSQPPNLKLLYVFGTVARHLSFTRAAVELRRSQATLSVQVRELERQLNVPLLVRTTRRVALTEAGSRLAEAVTVGFAAIEAGVAETQQLGDARRDRVVLACVPSLSSTRLPTMLARYREKDRKTRIDVEELASNEMIGALLDRKVDFGVGPSPEPPPPEISFSPAVDDPLYVLLSAGKDTWSREGIPFERLSRLPLITLSGSVLLQEMLERIAAERGLRLTTGAEVRHMQTAIAMAQAGVGAAVAPRLALPDIMEPGVLMLPIIDPPIARKVGVITLAGWPLEPRAARIAQYIRGALAQFATSPPCGLDAASSGAGGSRGRAPRSRRSTGSSAA